MSLQAEALPALQDDQVRRLTTRQYVGLVCNLNSRMDQLPPLFEDSQMLDESELVDSLAINSPRNHKAVLIFQGFNPETANLETFMEHCERAETTNDTSSACCPRWRQETSPRKCRWWFLRARSAQKRYQDLRSQD